MFAPAEWENDVPESTADFGVVHKRKNEFSLKKKATETISSTKIKKRRNKTHLNRTHVIHNTGQQPTQNNSKKMATCKRPYPTEETEYSTEVDDKPQKNKKHKGTSNIFMEGDLDETLIANTKKEMYSSLKPKELEQTLFSNNTVSKGDLDKTIMTKKEKFSSVKSKNLERKLLKKNSVPKGNLDELKIAIKKKDVHSSVKSKKLEQTLLIKNTIPPLQVTSDGVQKHNKKKDKIINVLQTHSIRSPLNKNGAVLYQRMKERLKAAQFRFLNEELYLSEGKDAKERFKADPTSFKVYHDGYRQQVKKWPINPLEIIIKKISKMPHETKVADMGCGEGILAERVPQKVRSFDLVSLSERVEECDMAHTPLLTAEMDVAVFCLALMGTNLNEYFMEANRILKVGGIMKIAEVESRFQNMNEFIKGVESYGFKMTHMDDSHEMFYFIDFKKTKELGKRNKLPHITLNPCHYKKR